MRFHAGLLAATIGLMWVAPTLAAQYTPRLVKDINPGDWSSMGIFSRPVDINGRLYFAGIDEPGETATYQFMTSDGTAAGTYQLVDLVSQTTAGAEGVGIPSTSGFTYHILGDQILVYTRSMLTRTDGTQAGTGPIGPPEWNGVWVDYPHLVYDDNLYLTVQSTEGRTIWVTDGTDAGTNMLGDGYQLRMSYHIDEDVSRHATAVAGDWLYFLGEQDGVHGLYRTDGTAGNTQWLTAFTNTSSDGPFNPYLITGVGDKVLFAALSRSTGYEMYVTDGTEAGTTMLVDGVPGFGSSFSDGIGLDLYYFNHTAVGDKVLYTTESISGYGHAALWVTDGTSAGTEKLLDYDGFAEHVSFKELNDGRVFFVDENKTWIVSDGTAEGTGPVTGSLPLGARFGAVWNNELEFFVGDHLGNPLGDVRDVLWVTDGTEEGTRMIFETPGSIVDPINRRSAIGTPTLLGDQLLFSAPVSARPDGTNINYELFVIDIPEPGTVVMLGVGAAALMMRRRRAA